MSYKRKEIIGDCTLYLGDCMKVMQGLDDGLVDLTVTSPPYDNLRTYEDTLMWDFDIFKNIAKEIYRVTKSGGVLVWVVGDSTRNGNESGMSFKQALYFKEIGFNLHDTMIFEKPQACFGSNNCYLQSFEYMFVFSKGKPKTINLIKDRENVRGGKLCSATSTALKPNGQKAVRKTIKTKKYGRRKNIWRIGVGGGKVNHPAVFPEKLASGHIDSWSKDNDIIFDPFLGSGTTAKASVSSGRKFIGIEVVNNYFEMSCERINEAYVQQEKPQPIETVNMFEESK